DEVAYISGEHLSFSVEDDGVYATDTSANGTAVNGEPLAGDTAQLEDGDVLVLADRAEAEVRL
ncbi:MAG: FHA domain-containing protein, partial [Halobacteriales archaeon]